MHEQKNALNTTVKALKTGTSQAATSIKQAAGKEWAGAKGKPLGHLLAD